MTKVIALYNGVFNAISGLAGDWLLPSLARFTFAATLLIYYWNSAQTKLGEGIFGLFHLSLGGYAQIFPKAMEAASYNTDSLTWFHWAVAVAGTAAEFILPLLIAIGLLTRLAALGMIGFVALQSLTDLYGHGGINQPDTLGAWFDRVPDSTILDQRLFWLTILVVLIIKGAGVFSVDHLLGRKAPA